MTDMQKTHFGGLLSDLWLDLQALPRWRDRAALVGAHLFPGRDHLSRRGGGGPLAWQYARRIARGAARFLRR